MKKFLKNNIKLILVFLLGIIVSSGITAYAVNNYMSEQIRYQNNTFAINNVSEALDDLYSYSKDKVDNYDLISKPNLWEVGREYDFGDGVYGIRKKGFIRATTEAYEMVYTQISPGVVNSIIDYGGTIMYYIGDSNVSTLYIGLGSSRFNYKSKGVSVPMPATGVWIDDGDHDGDGSLFFFIESNAIMPADTNTYDVWALYTKE